MTIPINMVDWAQSPAAGGAYGTVANIVLPTTIKDNDLLILLLTQYNAAPGKTLTGWNQLWNTTATGGTYLIGSQCWWKKAVAADAQTTITFNTTYSARANVAVIRGGWLSVGSSSTVGGSATAPNGANGPALQDNAQHTIVNVVTTSIMTSNSNTGGTGAPNLNYTAAGGSSIGWSSTYLEDGIWLIEQGWTGTTQVTPNYGGTTGWNASILTGNIGINVALPTGLAMMV